MASTTPCNLLVVITLLLYITLTSNAAALQPPIGSPPSESPAEEANNNIQLPSPDDIDGWCKLVPHPGPCKHFMSKMPHKLKPKRKLEFRKMIVGVALEQTIAAQAHTWEWGHNCTTHKRRAAWLDCIKLYDDTVIQLNRTLQDLEDDTKNYDDFSKQTWLSAALTNLDTCLGGSKDLNVSDFINSHVSYNVSDLISNSLAINDGIVTDEFSGNYNYTSSTTQGFPSWVAEEDRRLLYSRRSLLAVRKADYVVAKDGSGRYRTVQSAINAAARRRGRRVIFVKRGVYRENIWVSPYNHDIMLVGDGMKHTIIVSSRSVGSGYTTYSSATAGIDGLRFIAREITFMNAAGPNRGQAVALRSSSDLSVFYRVAFYGYQDTLFAHSQRQFYKSCYIFGTVDIIFGNAAAIIQNSVIFVRRPVYGQTNVITAQGRADPNQNTGTVIHGCVIGPAPDLKPVVNSVSTYLGRPWQPYSRTIVMRSYMGSLIHPAGWLEWNSAAKLRTLFYAEYGNLGPGSNLRRRVRWPGFHVIGKRVATQFTVANFIAGRAWIPSTGVPFKAGL